MAELADALDSGSSESNFMQVQVLFPAPKKKARQKRWASFFVNSGNGLEEAAMNQAPVGLENGADRAASSRENPVLFPAPNQYNPNQIFQIGNGFGFFLTFHYDYFENGRRRRASSKRRTRYSPVSKTPTEPFVDDSAGGFVGTYVRSFLAQFPYIRF